LSTIALIKLARICSDYFALHPAALGLLFLLGGTVKIIDDIGLYLSFRSTGAEHELR
jgi:hypothetical protein